MQITNVAYINRAVFKVVTDGTNGKRKRVIATDVTMYHAIEAARNSTLEDVIVIAPGYGMVGFVNHEGVVVAPDCIGPQFKQQVKNLQAID